MNAVPVFDRLDRYDFRVRASKREGKPIPDKFPTPADVEKADIEQLARWYRFLLPKDAAQEKVMEKISATVKAKGGITPALSRKIGYGGV